jgi:hypothetical protein
MGVKNEIRYLGASLNSRARWEKEIKQVALRRMKVVNYINVLSESSSIIKLLEQIYILQIELRIMTGI